VRALLRGGLLVVMLLLLAVTTAWAAKPGPAKSRAGAEGSRQADPAKVLRLAFPVAETGFDPARVSDLYSNIINGAIFERLFTYDWLARPVQLVPMLAQAMPEIADAGRTLTFRLRRGVMFTPDAAFKGKPRELVAQDVVYSIMRHMDPRNRSPWRAQVAGKIEGLDALYEQASREGGRFDYDAIIAGLEAVDKHTLRIRLVRPDPTFLHVLATNNFGVMAREVVERYGFEDIMAHPVGTGPYRLDKWTRGAKILLAANPGYRGFTWNFTAGSDPDDQRLVKLMTGRRMPAIGRVEIAIIEEPQSLWLAFNGGELDIVSTPASFVEKALTADNQLQPELAQRGIGLHRSLDPDTTFQFFNLRDPVLGGFTKERIALRRAIIMAYDVDEEIRVIRKGQAVRTHWMAPPAIGGHDAAYRSSQRFDPALANALLDKFGYRKGPDGFRNAPDGQPLSIPIYSTTASVERERDELWKKSLDRIGLRADIRKDKFPELLKQAKACQVSSWGAAWIAAIPDADYFVQLLYGKNIGERNYACFANEQWDALYEKTRELPDGPARNALYRDMHRLMEVNAAWLLGTTRYRNQLYQPQVLGYKKHPVLHADFMYLDLERAR
jgi:oligopeptide transport system substrate-binding protein